ncbi:TIGR03960 family B12-binding radical SAM protein [Sedimentibacter hydroxybenzoicus DSM 7310]|uniref:TIGR03960 family B12-binding radical SAM protein n=1 Tax=Sedimentibacter hydroxybenzoicus DSM 7310 TaxID=1123245 RepID=A0A974GWD2_SEDHY|nr:TIGR03960 family B12-binding radical SAM protein [Sedimentibacter hydroxybenzoicus]NYB74181.1 TIGR03960 family B12-binding radical SAM protein [Sedimentibacter hydroxybenzoicus DSM 7310]
MINIKKLDRELLSVEKPARYVGSELNSVIKNKEDVSIRFAFAFPDVYEVGMSHTGLHILYHLLNSKDNIWCERVFAPWTDMEKVMRKNDIPLYGLESKDELKKFDFVGFTLQYEMSYTNVLNMLNLADIPIRSKDRTEDMPIVIAGGPCAYNPEPLYEVVDLFTIGESEELILELMELYEKEKISGFNKLSFLEKAAHIEGVYVPRFYEETYNDDGTIKERKILNSNAKEVITKRIIKDLDKSFYPEKSILPYIDVVHDRVVLEVFRGCTRGCRFCQAGMVYRPVREKSPDTLVNQVESLINSTGHDEISLTSLSTGDYSCLPDLTLQLLDKYENKNVSISLPSLRLDSMTFDIIERLQEVRKSGLTFAPEAGTQRMRDVINKNLTEEQILGPVETAFNLGWSTVKLYFMIGLPGETMEDVMGIKELSYKVKDKFFQRPKEEIKGNLKINVSASCFVPKPFTPFQWVKQDSMDEFYDKAKSLQKEIKDKKVSFSYHEPKLSYLEAVFARGDRRLSDALIKAFEKGCRFDGWYDVFDFNKWMEAFEETDTVPDFFAKRERELTEVLPWDFIDTGITKKFLISEYNNAMKALTTSDCRQQCYNCGVNHKLIGGACPHVINS